MKSLHLREAKASFSTVVEAAEHGEPTIITKHGEPAAMVVPIADGRRLYPAEQPSFAEFLLSFPGSLETERDQTSLRGVEL